MTPTEWDRAIDVLQDHDVAERAVIDKLEAETKAANFNFGVQLDETEKLQAIIPPLQGKLARLRVAANDVARFAFQGDLPVEFLSAIQELRVALDDTSLESTVHLGDVERLEKHILNETVLAETHRKVLAEVERLREALRILGELPGLTEHVKGVLKLEESDE